MPTGNTPHPPTGRPQPENFSPALTWEDSEVSSARFFEPEKPKLDRSRCPSLTGITGNPQDKDLLTTYFGDHLKKSKEND